MSAKRWKPIETVQFYPTDRTASNAHNEHNRFSVLHKRLKQTHDKQTRTTSHVRNSFLQWNVYPRQDLSFEAMNRMYSGSINPRKLSDEWELSPCVFSFEYDAEHVGRRKFLVTNYRDFWKRYTALPSESRHFYEIIREDTPCHLYFDIEYKIDLNPHINGSEIMHRFKLLLASHLAQTFGILDDVSRDIVDLTSTTESKFSRHLIVHIPGAMFRNNAHVGAYVLAFVNGCLSEPVNKETFWVTTERISDDEASTANHEKVPFLDLGVYTKNRSFRIWKSSKIGKKVVLNLIDGDMNMRLGEREYEIFLKTLVCAPCISYPQSLKLLEFGVSSGADSSPISTHSDGTKIVAFPKNISSFPKSKSSPFPEIDHYIVSHLNSQFPNHRAFVRSCSYQTESKTIFYLIGGNRYCHNVCRHHKSNGVYYVVWLLESLFRQRCFDPDCQYFQSHAFPLPLDMNPFLSLDCEAEWTDEHHMFDEGRKQEKVEDDAMWDIPDDILEAELSRIENPAQSLKHRDNDVISDTSYEIITPSS